MSSFLTACLDSTTITITIMTKMMVVMTVISNSRVKMVTKKCLPDRSVNGSSHDNSRLVNTDDLYDLRQMCSPEHNLINHTIIIWMMCDGHFTAIMPDYSRDNDDNNNKYNPRWSYYKTLLSKSALLVQKVSNKKQQMVQIRDYRPFYTTRRHETSYDDLFGSV